MEQNAQWSTMCSSFTCMAFEISQINCGAHELDAILAYTGHIIPKM